MGERLANLSYGAMIPEVTPGVPLTPNIFFPFYKNSLNTDLHLDEDNPIAGIRSAVFQQYMGQREHTGALEVLAEPNTTKYWLDMLFAQGNVSGGGPYTWPYTEGLSKSYSMDFAKGQIVERFFGVMAEDMSPIWDKNKMKYGLGVSARGSFLVGQVATISTVTITLDTTKDPAPTKGLVAGDLVRVIKADGSSSLDTTIAASGVNADGITITLSASAAAYAAGDFLVLRPQTPSYVLKTPFLWARTEFRFGSSAAGALAAAHTPIENGAGKWKLSHKFEKKGGSDRSGSFDPASLVRLQTDADVNLKMFFDAPNELQRFLNVGSQYCVIRHFSESGYELRITLNQLKYKAHKRDLESGKIIYADIDGRPNYNLTDGQMFDVKVLNNISS